MEATSAPASRMLQNVMDVKMEPVTMEPSVLDMSISSVAVDELLRNVLEAQRQRYIDLPDRLEGWAATSLFSSGIARRYRAEDLNYIRTNLLPGASTLSLEELRALQAILSWSFMNIGTEYRSVIGALGFIVKTEIESRDPESPGFIHLGSFGPISQRIAEEPAVAIETLIYDTVVSAEFAGNLRKNISMVDQALVTYFKNIRETCQRWREDPKAKTFFASAVKRNLEWARDPNANQDDGVSIETTGNRILLRTCLSAQSYMLNGEAAKLRSFLTNSGRMAMVVRVRAANNPTLARLATDYSDIVHSLEASLAGSSMAAGRLIKRVEQGEIIYDEISEWGGFHHRLVAVELRIVLALFSHLLRRAEVFIGGSNDFIVAKKAAFSYPGITAAYREADAAVHAASN